MGTVKNQKEKKKSSKAVHS